MTAEKGEWKTEKTMLRLLYFSTAQVFVTRNDVDEIAASSAVANKRQNVTGALGYNGRNFCQVLEGEPRIVRALAEKIAKDDRHSGFKVIGERTVTDRFFGEWSMRLIDDLDFDLLINAMRA